MALIDWTDKLSVGVQQMDIQHKKLVGLINELYSAMSTGQGNQILQKTLGELVTYTKVHFKSEEQLMQQYGYPHLSGHKKLHDDLTAKATELSQGIKAGKAVSAVYVGNFLKDWLQNHIMNVDLKYGQFILQHSAV